MEIEQGQREEARWRILDAGRPIGVNESIVRRVLHDIKIALSIIEVRRELDNRRTWGSSASKIAIPRPGRRG
jgi:hypothetical protein